MALLERLPVQAAGYGNEVTTKVSSNVDGDGCARMLAIARGLDLAADASLTNIFAGIRVPDGCDAFEEGPRLGDDGREGGCGVAALTTTIDEVGLAAIDLVRCTLDTHDWLCGSSRRSRGLAKSQAR